MPQKYQDYNPLIPLDPPSGGGYSPLIPLDPPDSLLRQVAQQPSTLKTPTWEDDLITGGMRTILPIAGGIFGSVIPGWGTYAGGAGGAAWGEDLAQRYEMDMGFRNEYNPLQVMTQGALGSIGGFVKAPAAGMAAGAKEIAKYLGKNMLEGGVINAASTVPTQMAESYELPSMGQVGSAFGIGAGFGGLVAPLGLRPRGALPKPGSLPSEIPFTSPRPDPHLPPSGPPSGPGGPPSGPMIPPAQGGGMQLPPMEAFAPPSPGGSDAIIARLQQMAYEAQQRGDTLTARELQQQIEDQFAIPTRPPTPPPPDGGLNVSLPDPLDEQIAAGMRREGPSYEAQSGMRALQNSMPPITANSTGIMPDLIRGDAPAPNQAPGSIQNQAPSLPRHPFGGAVQMSNDGNVVSISRPSAEIRNYFLSNGFKVTGAVTTDGHPILVRDPSAGQSQGPAQGQVFDQSGTIAPPPAPMRTTPPERVRGRAIPEGRIGLTPGSGQPIDVPSAVVKGSYFRNMAEQGYIVDPIATNDQTTRFIYSPENAKALLERGNGGGGPDFQRTEEYERLRAQLGREPTFQELSAARARPMAGERTGGIAPFEPTSKDSVWSPDEIERAGGKWDVFYPRGGRTIQTFNSEMDAQRFMNTHPEGKTLDYAPHKEGWNDSQKGERPSEGFAQYLNETYEITDYTEFKELPLKVQDSIKQEYMSKSGDSPEAMPSDEELAWVDSVISPEEQARTDGPDGGRAMLDRLLDENVDPITRQKNSDELLRILGGVPQTDEMMARMDPRIRQRVQMKGPRLFNFDPQTPQMGQGELPLLGVREQTRLQDIANARNESQMTGLGDNLPGLQQGDMFADLRARDELRTRQAREAHLREQQRRGLEPTDEELRAIEAESHGMDDDVEGPSFAMTPDGKLIIGSDVISSAKELTTGYKAQLPTIMVREGLQNALDAIRHLGNKGDIQIDLDEGRTWGPPSHQRPVTLTIRDNGKGMSRDELFSVYSDLNRSGKRGDPTATGGKGVGKATYMLGGDHFKVETTKEINGKKYTSTLADTPDNILRNGVDVVTVEADPHAQTGTVFTTTLQPDQHHYHMVTAMQNIIKYSRNLEGKVKFREMHGVPRVENSLMGNPKNTVIANDLNVDGTNNKLDLLLPENVALNKRSSIYLEVLNNGMWQYTDHMYIDETPGIPERVIVDLKPQVGELDPRYPFPVQRESIKDNVKNEIEAYIKRSIVSPMGNKKKMDMAKLWNQMIPTKGVTVRDTVFFDPGDRLLPDEVDFIKNSRVVQELQEITDEMLEELTSHLGTDAQDKLVRVGLSMDPNYYGVHIPNPNPPPGREESAIFMNYFEHMTQKQDATESSFDSVITGLHEGAHIKDDQPPRVELTIDPAALTDPRVGKWFLAYLNQVNVQGGINFGHGMPFVRRLGDIFARTGPEFTFKYADKLQNAITRGGQSGGYSPEVQKLLQIYSDSRGRPATTEDIISGTGIIESSNGRVREGDVSGSTQANGNGTTPTQSPLVPLDQGPQFQRVEGGVYAHGKAKLEEFQQNREAIRKAGKTPPSLMDEFRNRTGIGKGEARPPRGENETNVVKEGISAATQLATTLDASPGGRQALTMIHTKAFWKAMNAGYKAAKSADVEKAIMDEIRAKPIFQRPFDPATGKSSPSIAEKNGIGILDDNTPLNAKEESLSSSLIEKGEFETKNGTFRVPVLSPVWKHTVGKPIRASSRFYRTFLTHLRANRYEELLNKFQAMSIKAEKTGEIRPNIFSKKVTPDQALDYDPYTNEVLAKELADYVNTATGRGPLKTHLWPTRSGEKSAEHLSNIMQYGFFSPRNIASRVRMMNPLTYVMATPAVRKEYLKSMLAATGAWYAMTELGKMAGGEVEMDPTSSDFGKIRFGDTRFDPGGGFLQYFVLYSRGLAGGYTSAATGKWHRYGSGYQAETQKDYGERFFANKLNPVAKFAYDWANASENVPLHLKDRATQMFIPLAMQDMYEIVNERPSLLPWMVPVMFGMGTQTYSAGETSGKFIRPEDDWLVTGGGPFNAIR